MVFQNYALYPHMTVAQNIAFPLRQQSVKRREIRQRVEETAQLLDIPAGHVNIKATTTDHLGFIGRAEGICAMAIVGVEIKP